MPKMAKTQILDEFIAVSGYVLKAERQMEELRGRIKRDFYNGRPTRKFRQLLSIERRLNAYLDSPGVQDLLKKKWP